MALWPRLADETPPPDVAEITREVQAFRGHLPAWEASYLEYHRQRYQDTLRLLPPGEGRRLLDVGSFPGHLSALAQARGWEVAGLNNAIEGAGPWADFLERCGERKITIHRCEVEWEPFPLQTASVDAVLFSELFEHLHLNPFHALKEIFRVLRPGGLLLLTTPNLRRVETFSRLWHGWGSQPPVNRPFHELFPSLLYHRHNREYTAKELVYYLARQGKDLYDFRLDRVYYSDAFDAGHEIPGVLGERVGAGEQRLARVLRRLIPRLRGQLIVRAWRTDSTLVEWAALQRVEGFGPVEDDERPTQGFTRRLTFPFRLTGACAGFDIRLPPGPGPVLLTLMVAHPDGDTPLRTEWSLNNVPVQTHEFVPSPRPVRLHLLVPAMVAAHDTIHVGVVTSTWRDDFRGREVGLHVGAQWVLAQRLAGSAAVPAAVARVQAEHRAEDGGDPWWSTAPGLHLVGTRFRPVLEMGPGDEDQLGAGWFWLEDWGKLGAMRWTGGQAQAYLGQEGQAGRVVIRAYSGDARLGPVSGRLVVEHVEIDGQVTPAGETDYSLPPDTWAELTVPLRAAAGLIRVTIRTEPLRVPRDCVPGSADHRGLGLAIKRLWLAR